MLLALHNGQADYSHSWQRKSLDKVIAGWSEETDRLWPISQSSCYVTSLIAMTTGHWSACSTDGKCHYDQHQRRHMSLLKNVYTIRLLFGNVASFYKRNKYVQIVSKIHPARY